MVHKCFHMYTKLQKKEKRERIRKKRENKKNLLKIMYHDAIPDCLSIILSYQNFIDQDINNIALVCTLYYNVVSEIYAKIKIVRLVLNCKGGKMLENAFVAYDMGDALSDIFEKEYAIQMWSRIIFTKNTTATANDMS